MFAHSHQQYTGKVAHLQKIVQCKMTKLGHEQYLYPSFVYNHCAILCGLTSVSALVLLHMPKLLVFFITVFTAEPPDT